MRTEYLYCRNASYNPVFTNFIESLGGDSSELMRELCGEGTSTQEKLNFKPWASMHQLFEGAARTLDEPQFGLKLGLKLPNDLRSTGPNVFLFSISNNIEHFIKLAINYHKLHSNAFSLSYRFEPDRDEFIGNVSFHPMAQYSRQYLEFIMVVITRLAFRFIPDFEIKKIEFQHNKPEDTSLYETAFKCPVEFNCDANNIIADRKWLSFEKCSYATKALEPLIKTYVNWRLKKDMNHKATIAMTLAELLPSLLGVRKSDIATIASSMNISPKKLQRLLQDEGTSYSEVLDNVRKNLASQLLLDTEIPLLRIALLLDYATDKPFIAAFKRWFDETPARYRKKGRTI